MLGGSYRVFRIEPLDLTSSNGSGGFCVYDSLPINRVGPSRHFHLFPLNLLKHHSSFLNSYNNDYCEPLFV